jgi:hypothetical protein
MKSEDGQTALQSRKKLIVNKLNMRTTLNGEPWRSGIALRLKPPDGIPS